MEEEITGTAGTRPIKNRKQQPKAQAMETETEKSDIESDKPVTNDNATAETGGYFDSTERELTQGLSEVAPSASGTPLDNPVIEHEQAKINFTGDTIAPLKEQTTQPVAPPVAAITPPPQQEIQQQIPPVVNNNADPPPVFPNQQEQKEIRDQNLSATKTFATEQLKEHDKTTQAPANPAITTMSKADVEKNTLHTVETAIWLYCKIKQGAVNFVGKTSPRQLSKLEQQRKLDRNWAVFFDSAAQRAYTVAQMIELVNKDIEKAGQTDPEFISKIRPLLIDEFTKRGWALSPQQNIFLLLGQDILKTVQTVGALKMQVTELLNRAMKEYEVESRGGGLSERQMYNKRFFSYVAAEQQQQHVQQQATIQTQPVAPTVEEDKKEPAEDKNAPRTSEPGKRKIKKPED